MKKLHYSFFKYMDKKSACGNCYVIFLPIEEEEEAIEWPSVLTAHIVVHSCRKREKHLPRTLL
jgi:hypothetical protein